MLPSSFQTVLSLSVVRRRRFFSVLCAFAVELISDRDTEAESKVEELQKGKVRFPVRSHLKDFYLRFDQTYMNCVVLCCLSSSYCCFICSNFRGTSWQSGAYPCSGMAFLCTLYVLPHPTSKEN